MAIPNFQVEAGEILRSNELERRIQQVKEEEAQSLKRSFVQTESEVIGSLPHASGSRITEGEIRFRTILPLRIMNDGVPEGKPAKDNGLLLFKRKQQPKGPLAVFGYDYFADHAKAAGIETPKLLGYEGLWGGSEEYAYEVLNFANGERNSQQIRDAVSAEYGPVPFELVAEYLAALEKIGVVEKMK
jgi:hypothetical protein